MKFGKVLKLTTQLTEEEQEKLKEICDQFNEMSAELYDLRKENEELKEDIDRYKKMIDELL